MSKSLAYKIEALAKYRESEGRGSIPISDLRLMIVAHEAAETDTRPCPICQTNCSGCLEDLSAKQEGLRELRSYCVVQEEVMLSHFNPPSASDVFGEIATKLGELLDGES